MVKLLRELLLLSVLLIISVVFLLVNVSSNSKSEMEHSTLETTGSTTSQPIVNKLGKQLFRNNCAACHNRNMQDGLVGPALGGVRERWKNNDVEIYDFILNSQKVIQGGNKYAKDLFQKWERNQMPSFTNLKRNEMDAILNYIDEVYKP